MTSTMYLMQTVSSAPVRGRHLGPMEGRGPSASRRDQPWSENNQDTWADHHNSEEKVKKEKKWSIGKLFRRKKKDTESESSDSSNDNSQKQKKRKSHSKKRESSKNNGNDIIISHNKRSQSVTKVHKKEYPDEGVLSDPSAGFVGYVGRGLPRSPFDRSHFTSKDSLERKGAGSSTGSQDGSLRKGRKGRIKARVEAIRNLKHESSSDEESQKSTSSSILKFRSDDSLANHSKDGSIGRRTRSARTDRYIKRLSRDDEVQLNREADLIQKGFSRSEAELMALKHRVLSTPQMVERDRSMDDPDYSELHIVADGYNIKRNQNSGSHQQIPEYASVQRGGPNTRVNLRQPGLSASNSSVYSYPAGVINFNAQVNNENITYSVPYNNIKKTPQSDSLPNKPTFRRSASVENSNSVYGPTIADENVIVVKFPLGSTMKKDNPPPPPPRDPQRKIPTPISSLYENSRPLSYAFEPSSQSSVPFRKSEDRSNMAPVEYRNSKNIYQGSVLNHSGNALNWSKRPTSTSEDHIAMQQSNYNPSSMNHYSNEQPKRPSSVTGETLRPEIYNRYLARPQINRVNMPNSVPRRHTQENNNSEFQYYADKTPRSRKPIHIAKTSNPDFISSVDSKVPAPQNGISQRPRNASDFWKKIDSQASQKKVFGHNRTLSDTSIYGVFNGQVDSSTVNPGIRNFAKPNITNGFQENDRLKLNNFRNASLYNNRINNDEVTLRVKKEEEPICYSNIDIIPMDDVRKGSQSGKNSDEDPTRGRRKSTNLEDALSELEAIYNSLGLGDEDLLDRAERRELTTPKTTEPYPFSSSDRDNYFRFPSYSDYTDNASVLKKQNQFNRRSSIPDKMHDDMAYRRMNPHERPKSKDVNTLVSQVSYMLSPTLGDQRGPMQNGESTDDQEPDVILDDVVFRNLRQANNYLKIEDPQPPFGIPIGPVSPAPYSDYLHVTPEAKSKSRFIPQESPDVVTDDLAYRSLRKDRNASPLGNTAIEVLINNSSENKSMSQPSKMFDNHVIKKKKAVRSMSANIFTMIQREIDDALGLCSSRALEKAQSIPDLPDAVLEFGKSGKIPSNFRASQIIEPVSSTTSAAPSGLAPNYDNEARTNARNNFLFDSDDKVTNRSTLSVTPDKLAKESSSDYRKPVSPKKCTQSETEDALDIMAQEAKETSAKLVLALEELQKEKSPLKLNAEHKVPTKSHIEDTSLLKTNNNITKINFLNDRSIAQNVESGSKVSMPKAAERRNLFDENDYVNITEFSDFRRRPDNTIDKSQGKGRSTEDSLIEISNQLRIAGDKIKPNSEHQDNFEDEGAKLRALAKQCDINLNKTASQAEIRNIESKVIKETKFVPFENSVAKNQSSYDNRFHVNTSSMNMSSTAKTILPNDSKLNTLEEMQSFDDLRKGISDLLDDISNVTDKYKAKKTEELNAIERIRKESPIEMCSQENESEKSKDNRGSPEYNSSEELAMIFNLTKDDAGKSSNYQDEKKGDEKESHMDLNSPRLVNTVNQNFRKTSTDETKLTEKAKPPCTAPQAPTVSDAPWRVNRRQPTADSASKGTCDNGLCSTKRRSWYRDPNTVMLACSYTLICTQQLAGLDFLTLLGIVLAMISIIAMLII